MPTKTPKKKVAKKAIINKKRLSAEQELFCQLYAGNHVKELFGNATRSYMEAYGYNSRIQSVREQIDEQYQLKDRGFSAEIKSLESKIKSIEGSARTAGNRMFTIVSISNRVNEIMDSMIRDDFNDREMLYTIGQRYDLASKIAAIREYNQLKKRIQKDPPAQVGPISIQISPDVLNKMGL